ncbi:MAG TPA: C2H2-type zinc finger protein [Acidobacteriota bacterium]|nr:C2H2-type zinc finger protein [Acidobacteriota bacterium]
MNSTYNMDMAEEGLDTGAFDMERSNPRLQPFRCPVCQKAFPTQMQLDEHMRIQSHRKRQQ